MIQTASRMEVLSPHYFSTLGTKIATMRASGMDVIRLDEGSPDLPPAPHIVEALARSAAAADRHAYQPHAGPRTLRQAWAEMYARLYRVELDPDREVLPLLGSKEGIFHLLMAYIQPGDIVLIPDPGYITYTRGTLFAGGEPYYLPLLQERDYLPDLNAVPAKVLERAKVLWLNYPNNPTAAVAPLSFFQEAVAFARENDLLICHDAAYAQVYFDGKEVPSLLQIAGAKEAAVEFNTLSKSHNMAGWRVGALVGNADVLYRLFVLKTNLDSSHFLPVMEAATAAMVGDQGWLVDRNAIYQQRRDVIVGALREMGLEVKTPQASLYVWSPIPAGWKSYDFCAWLLDEAQVSVTPGAFFGQFGEGYMRISITTPVERICLAMDRMKSALGRRSQV